MNNRYAAIRAIATETARYAPADTGILSAMQESFGSRVFSDAVMRQMLSEKTYRKVRRTIDNGERLDVSVAGEVAEAMKISGLWWFTSSASVLEKLSALK